MKPTFKYMHVIQLLRSRECGAELDNACIKINIIRDYLRTEECLDTLLREALAESSLGSDEERVLPCDPTIILDDDGELALTLPNAEGLLISGASQRHFRCALALILIIETCYDPTVGSPCRVNASLRRFQPLIKREGLPPAALLHEFLEVDEPLDNWFSHQVNKHQLVRGEDYFVVPSEASLPEMPFMEYDAWEILLNPDTATNIACTTPTVRGRKVSACLIDPGVIPSDYTEQDPALLDLLFVPPSRGLASL